MGCVFREFALIQLVFDGSAILPGSEFLLIQDEGSVRTKRIPLVRPLGQWNPQRFAHGAHHLLEGGVDPQVVVAELARVGERCNHLLYFIFAITAANRFSGNLLASELPHMGSVGEYFQSWLSSFLRFI